MTTDAEPRPTVRERNCGSCVWAIPAPMHGPTARRCHAASRSFVTLRDVGDYCTEWTPDTEGDK